MKFMQIKPQKARGKLEESMWTDPSWVAEEKYDGDRRIAQFCTDAVRFTGTRESVDGTGFVEKTANLPQLHKPVPELVGTVLDGEIVAPYAVNLPGGKSKYVTAIMGSKPDEAIRKQKASGWLGYVVFDCLRYKGQDVRHLALYDRRLCMQKTLRAWLSIYAQPILVYETDKRVHYDAIVVGGGEGVVLKHKEHTYGNEKLWVKVKAEATADVVILGFEAGKGKYKRLVGAIVFGQYLRQTVNGKPHLARVGTCSGFDDGVRFDMTHRPQAYIGRVIEIAHNGREPTGAFRHPRFKRFRPDKAAKDCVFDMEER